MPEPPSMTLLERDPVAYYKIHARNVDKQRRRLLVMKCERRAHTCDQSADYFAKRSDDANSRCDYREGDLLRKRALWCDAHASKLRTIAARLRGTK